MKIIVSGLAVEYQDEGAGYPLLLLHGWGDTMRTFDTLATELKGRYRIVRLDLPGFGKTELPPESWDVEKYAIFIRDFLEKIHVEPHAVAGHSLGGRIVIKAISGKHIRAKRLVLIASAGNAKRRTFRNALLYIAAKLGKLITSFWPLSLLREAMRQRLYASIESDYPNTREMKETFLNVIREDLSKDAASITLPTLLIWGADDSTTPLTDGRRLAESMRSSSLVVLPHAGHFVHREKSDEVARAVEAFL